MAEHQYEIKEQAEPVSRQITKAEMAVLEVMYAAGEPLTMPEICRMANEKRENEWATQTVSTFLKRLSQKGLTRMQRDGRTYYHEPVLPYESFVADLSKDLINTWFGCDVSRFMDNFVKNVRPLTKSEMNALYGPFLGRDVV